MSKNISIVILMLLLFVGIASPISAYAQQSPPSLSTYEVWLREAFAAAQRNDLLGLKEVAPRLIETRQVALSNGATVPVDNGWLQEAMAVNDPDLEQITQRLGALIDALGHETTSAPSDANERLQRLLNNPPFVQQERPRTLIGDLLDWLFNLLERLFSPLGRIGSGVVSPVAWLVTIGGGLLIVGIIVYVLRGLRRNLVGEASAATEDSEAHMTATAASKQAAELARSGDYRTGVRYLYLSALLWLDERDVLRYDRALTNREYLEHLRDNSELRERLLPIVETFDRVWYGYAQLDAQGFERYRQQVEALRQ